MWVNCNLLSLSLHIYIEFSFKKYMVVDKENERLSQTLDTIKVYNYHWTTPMVVVNKPHIMVIYNELKRQKFLKKSTYKSCLFLLLMPTFDKMVQWQKKLNNMKKMERENSKIKTSRPERME